MNDAYYTSEGERPALAALEVNKPEGYIGHKLMPTVPVTEKTGVVYYRTVQADSTAQTARVAGVAPTATQISNSNTTFTTAEACKRAGVTPDEAKGMGGIAKADEAGAKWAKRQVMNYQENDIADLILASGSAADASFDAAKIQTQVQTALNTIKLYSGRTAIVGATYNMKALLQALLLDGTHGPVIARMVGYTQAPQSIEGLNLDVWMKAVALWFGVDDVMSGDDDIWNAADTLGRISVLKYDPGTDAMSHKYEAVFGKVWQFMPDGTVPWMIQSVPSRYYVNNFYDAFLWYDAIALNTGARYVLDGVPQ